ncbi:cellobiose transport system permease protein [Caldanaerobius fijiensis DSM 17918]|uniref:Cellobiose transport system permease protein n=1 Tax=Caldanaerobius fijiensis DSM 17918 TaxID=1121256 RepID=A0A1M5DAG8_9THEO|nr:sugar ABC transporter permease [Caldanaerobius fijiensis]SHF63682.1 cellobiose transport system permease protein [Caldanaerobius fijiensis DSM 17918]
MINLSVDRKKKYVYHENLWAEVKKNKIAYIYISPFYILYGIFGAFPLLFAFYLTFHNWDGISNMTFVGLQNYMFLFKDPLFWKSLYNTLVIAIVAHVPMLFLALVLAYILNSKMIKLKNFFRTIYFTPVVTSSVAVSLVFLTLYGVHYGLINVFLQYIGLKPIDWFGGNGFWIKPAIIILFIWRWLGWNMVIYYAGLQSIPVEITEAAVVDGANSFQTFFKVIIPLIMPIILYTVIMSTIGGLTIFDEPFMLVGPDGGTNNSGLTLSTYLYSQAFRFSHFGYAATFGFVISALIVIFSFINMKIFGNDYTK